MDELGVSPRVVVVGSLSLDEVVAGGRREHRLGGVVTYAGLTYRRAGLATSLCLSVGPGDRRLLDRLRRRGISVLAGESEVTTRFVNHVDGDDRRQEVAARARPISAAEVAAAAAGAELVHLGPLHPEDLAPEAAGAARASGAAVAVDLQGLVRRVSAGRVEEAPSRDLAAFLAAARWVKGDEREVAVAARALGMEPAQWPEAFGLAELLVTAGSHGGRVLTSRGESVYRAAPCPEPRDATGAGDVFFAAYLSLRVFRGADPEWSAAHAARIAAEHVAGAHLAGEDLALHGE